MDGTARPPLYGLDIETDTTVDGLDPAVGRVLAVAVVGADVATVLADDDEQVLLRSLDELLASLPAGVVVTWNGARFDLPYLATRAQRHGVALGLALRHDATLDPPHEAAHAPLPGHPGTYRASWHGHRHLDAYRLYRADLGPALHLGCSLKRVAALAGLAPVEVDASRVHELGPRQLHEYVTSDAACTAELARRRWSTARLAVDPAPARPGTGPSPASPGPTRRPDLARALP